MFKNLFLFLIILFIGSKVSAQSAGISGTVRDTSSKSGVHNAVIAVLSPGDSILKAFTRAGEDGSFAIQNLKPGKYILTVSHPAFADYVDDIEILSPDQKAGTIPLTSKSKMLEAVILKSGNPIKLRGDTTVYTADSFKVSANANVEELLKKMPGIQVDKNGTIKAMGETVEKVLVDGEEFFGDDPGMAVKNLRADAVKEVQVFDKKSDASVFTGIDDGKTQKTINLKLKDDRKHGYFGKLDVAGGPIKTLDPRYNSNLMYSSFKGKRKLSGFLLNGNTGQDGLNWQDEQKYGGDNDNMTMSMDDDGAMMFMSRGGSSDQEPYVDPKNGFITNVNAGLQYSNKWNDKTSMNLSPKFNSQVYNNNVQTFSQTLLPGDSVLNSYSDEQSHVNRHNIKIKGIYDVKIDSANSLKFTAGTNFYHTSSYSNTTGNSTNTAGNLLNDYERFFSTNKDKSALSGNAIFKHKFKKQRRTFSLTADWKSLSTDGINFQRSQNTDFANSFTQNIDQKTDFNTVSNTLQSQLIYTEPLSKRFSLELGYRIGLNNGSNDQISYSKSAGGKYDNAIDSLTNNFRQNIFEHSPSTKINYSYKKLKANLGAAVSFSDFQLKDLSNGNIYNRNYTNFAPSANLTYTYKANHNLRVNYSGTTVQPTIDQLQPLRKNDDYFNQYIGNPALRNSFRHNININHGTYNFLKDLWTFESVNLSLTENDIVNARTIDYSNGKTINQPVNTNGNMYLSFWTGAGFKLKKADIRLGFFPHGSYSKTAGILNAAKTFSKDLNMGTSASISKTKDKKYDVSLESDFGYTSDKASQSNTTIHYNANTLRANATVYYKKVWSLNGTYELYTRQKTEQSPAFNNSLLNARLQRTISKDEYTIYVSVHDLLNQNNGVDRNFFNSVYTETRNERLKRYFMVGFAWNFKNKPAAAKK